MKALIFCIVLVYMVVAMFRSIGIYELFSLQPAVVLLAIAGLCCLFAFNLQGIKRHQTLTLLVFFILFIYSATVSRFPATSLVLSFFMFASAIIFVGLEFADSDFAQNTKSANKYAITDSAKIAFIICTSIHALTMVVFYLFQPERTTGLMDDFSQASMLLLLAYAFAYPLFKDKTFFSAFSLIYFIACFTAFSRTVNLLLIVLFAALFLLELRRKNLKNVAKLAALAVIALGIVYMYPGFVGETTVDRGGLSHLSTLNSRTIYWQTAWQAIQQKPLLGHGLGLFSFTGIKEAQPFNIIYFVHNDYLQIWHDLGIFWLVLFVSAIAYLLFRYSPFKLSNGTGYPIAINSENSRRLLAWFMLLSIALYMSINFLIFKIEFQLAIAILLVDLLRTPQNKSGSV